jgi:hypothetical protein
MMIYGFDFDGTLVKSWTATPLPQARERLAALPPKAPTFVATNQGGPAFRAVLGDAKYRPLPMWSSGLPRAFARFSGGPICSRLLLRGPGHCSLVARRGSRRSRVR